MSVCAVQFLRECTDRREKLPSANGCSPCLEEVALDGNAQGFPTAKRGDLLQQRSLLFNALS